MLHQEKNEFGYITIDESLISQVIYEVIKSFNGNVWLANYKGKQNDLIIKIGDFDALSQLDISETDNGILVKIYIMTKFGQSISAVVNKVFDAVSKTIIDDLCLQIDNIVVELTGVISSKSIGKRNSTYSFNK